MGTVSASCRSLIHNERLGPLRFSGTPIRKCPNRCRVRAISCIFLRISAQSGGRSRHLEDPTHLCSGTLRAVRSGVISGRSSIADRSLLFDSKPLVQRCYPKNRSGVSAAITLSGNGAFLPVTSAAQRRDSAGAVCTP